MVSANGGEGLAGCSPIGVVGGGGGGGSGGGILIEGNELLIAFGAGIAAIQRVVHRKRQCNM